MTRAARTVYYFGWYLVALGAAILITPNTVLGLFRVAPTTEGWIRVLGVATVVVGYFYLQAARLDLAAFFRLTLRSRPFAFLTFTALVAFGLAPAPLLLFGAVELAGAVWTSRALRAT